MAPSSMVLKGLSREDVLTVLASMGIIFPPHTKMSDELLTKRLTQALDSAQQLGSVFADQTTPSSNNNLIVNPEKYPLWERDSERTVFQQMFRLNWTELSGGSGEMAQPKEGEKAPKEMVYKELKQALMALACLFDSDNSEACFVDAAREWGIFVRLVEVHRLKNNVPLFVFFYTVLERQPLCSVDDQHRALTGKINIGNITSSEVERRALLKLFSQNSKRVGGKFSNAAAEHEARALGLQPSFVVPLSPLSMRTLGKLTSNPGCEVCGEKDTSRCTQCLSASYCSKDCQRSDWNNHKSTCRSLKGGVWHSITVENQQLTGDFTIQGLDPFILGRLDAVHPSNPATNMRIERPGQPPPNIHEDRAFLAKFQISLTDFGDDAEMLVYDRQRSFHFCWKRKDTQDKNLFDDAAKMMGNKKKIYRWVKRVGVFGLSVCCDRPPTTDPLW